MKFIDLRFERWQVVGFGKQEESKRFHKFSCSWGQMMICEIEIVDLHSKNSHSFTYFLCL